MSKMYFSPDWRQQPYASNACMDIGTLSLRDRIQPRYEEGEDQGSSKETECLSPSDAFFGKPTSFVFQAKARQVPLLRPQKVLRVQRDVLEEPKQPQRHLPSLKDLQATDSATAKTLIGEKATVCPNAVNVRQLISFSDHFVDTRDALYSGALEKLVEAKGQIEGLLADATTENDRVFKDLEKHQRRTAKPLSETRINDNQTGENMLLGESVAAFKKLTDKSEADVESLWEQWADAQKEVDSIFAELADEQAGAAKNQLPSVAAVRESISREMDKFEKELDEILEQSHEEVRLSEAVRIESCALLCPLANFFPLSRTSVNR